MDFKIIIGMICGIVIALCLELMVIIYIGGIPALIFSFLFGILIGYLIIKGKIKNQNNKIMTVARDKINNGEVVFKKDGKELDLRSQTEKIDPETEKKLRAKLEKNLSEERPKESKNGHFFSLKNKKK